MRKIFIELMEIIEWKMDLNAEWDNGTECTTVGEVLKRAQAILDKQ